MATEKEIISKYMSRISKKKKPHSKEKYREMQKASTLAKLAKKKL